MSSPLLINESPLQVLPTLAVAIGLNEAIILQQVHYWTNNKDKRSKPHERDGRRWVYNTYDEWREQFPFWSVPTIKRAILSAEKKGVLISDQFDLETGDAKKFYSVDYTALNKLMGIDPSDQIDPTHQIKLIRPSDQIDPILIRKQRLTQRLTQRLLLLCLNRRFPPKKISRQGTRINSLRCFAGFTK